MKKITLSILSLAALALAAEKPIDVIAYSPYRDGQSPENGIQPTVDKIREDFRIIAPYVKGIRTYSTLGIYDSIPRLASEAGLEVWLGAWIGKDEAANQKQIKALIEQAGGIYKSTIKGLIVGNEVLERNDKSAAELVTYIQQVNNAITDIPVTTADNHNPMKNNSKVLAPEIDVVMVHIHPYFDGAGIDVSAGDVVDKWNSVKDKYPGKEVIVGETGFPSAGKPFHPWGAQPSLENQARFAAELIAKSKQVQMKTMLFTAFDENWKSGEPKGVGPNWGLWGSDRKKKLAAERLSQGVAIATPDRKLRVIPAADAALGGIDALGRLRLPGAAVGAPAKALPVWTISRP